MDHKHDDGSDRPGVLSTGAVMLEYAGELKRRHVEHKMIRIICREKTQDTFRFGLDKQGQSNLGRRQLFFP